MLLAAALFPGAASAADKADFQPKPETYICPNATGGGVECFLDAVEHLYTMCRQVKSIEIIEFGYALAEEGVNGAKSEYCVDKHKLSIVRPFQAAQREANGSAMASDALKGLHELWLRALLNLKWQPPEMDEDYKERVGKAYEVFRERASFVRTALLAQIPRKKPATIPGNSTANAGATPKHGAN